MRVLRIGLRNYRRHRDTLLELPDGVTALLGPNGSGKSTLLEALGFALFGTPAARTGKDLLRSEGAAPGDAVQVFLEAEVAGQAWRIVRELRGRSLSPQASLEVDGALLVAPGAGSSDAVTAEVERRLGMDRDAFFTTVVARQKELSRLADQAPAERRRLLFEMLGVDAVDRAVARARAERRSCEERLAALRSLLPDAAALDTEAAALDAGHRERLAASAAALEAWQAARGRLAQAAAALAAATESDARRRDAERTAQEARSGAQSAVAVLGSLEARLRDAEAARDRAALLGDTAAALASARRASLEEERSRAARARHAEASRALAEEGRNLADLEAAAPPLPGPAPDLEAAAVAVSAAEARHRETQAQAAAGRARLDHARLRRADLGRLGPEAPCPVCERPLAGHLEALRGRTDAELASLEASSRSAEAASLAAAAAREGAERHREAALRLDRERERRAAERRAWEARLAADQARLAALAAALPPAPTAGPDEALAAAALQEAERRHDQAVRAHALAEEAPRLALEAAALRGSASEAAERLRAAEAALSALPPAAPLEAVRRAHREAEEAERAAERQVHAASAEERLAGEAVAAARRRREEAARQRERVALDESELRSWNQLVGAKGGGLLEAFREHLAARIGPAVAQEASRLLAAFTGGRYAEVLLDADFNLFVADGGVRYALERFSGGEADLVHLALRLAVSRLLAARGDATEIRFLALDEVFGSLDRERRGLVLGALQALEGIYSQVLLVTHLEDLEDSLDRALRVADVDGRAVVSLHKG